MGWEAPILYSGADTSGRRRGLRPRRDQDMKDVNVAPMLHFVFNTNFQLPLFDNILVINNFAFPC